MAFRFEPNVNKSESKHDEDSAGHLYAGVAPGNHALLPEGEPLYRGAIRGPSNIHNNGFSSHGTNLDLLTHAFPPVEGEYFLESGYISTSVSKNVAVRFPFSMPLDAKYSYVYEIHPEKSAIDVLETLSKDNRIRSDFELSLLESEKEKAIPCKIKPREIKGCYPVKLLQGSSLTANEEFKLIRNILQNPSDGTTAYVNGYYRVLQDEFIPNPNYAFYQIQKYLKYVKATGIALAGIGLTLDSLNLWNEYKQSGATSNYDNTYRESVRMSGGWSGAYAAGVAGAKMGMIWGAPIAPPYGPAVGSIVAGLASSIMGYHCGSIAAMKIFDVTRSYASSQMISNLLDAVAISFGTVNFTAMQNENYYLLDLTTKKQLLPTDLEKFGIENPPKFPCNFKGDHGERVISNLSVSDIRKLKGTHNLIYVITDEGLIISSQVTQGMRNQHLHLAKKGPVYAAGHVEVVDGSIILINNSSGGYQPNGEHLDKLVTTVFLNHGFTEAPEKFHNPHKQSKDNGESNSNDIIFSDAPCELFFQQNDENTDLLVEQEVPEFKIIRLVEEVRPEMEAGSHLVETDLPSRFDSGGTVEKLRVAATISASKNRSKQEYSRETRSNELTSALITHSHFSKNAVVHRTNPHDASYGIVSEQAMGTRNLSYGTNRSQIPRVVINSGLAEHRVNTGNGYVSYFRPFGPAWSDKEKQLSWDKNGIPIHR